VPGLIEFRDVYKLYPMGDTVVRAVDGITMSIGGGEFVAIVGQSGSGKSTCMNIIGCLDVPSQGQYFLSGQDVGQLNDNQLADIRNRMLGFIFQQYNLLPKLNVLENVEISMIYGGVPKSERIKRAKAALDRVDLSDKLNNMPSQLSGGQQQRIACARALANGPKLILADEPTGNLDSKSSADIMDLLLSLNASGMTVVMVTHDARIAERTHRIVHMEDGRIIR